jgi:capsular exopolysaccharide synthesis family protein
VELRDFIRVLRRSWIAISLLSVVGVGAAAAYMVLATPMYKASTQVFVSTESTGTPQDLVAGTTFSQQRVKTYASIATSPLALQPVIDRLNLTCTVAELAQRVAAVVPTDTTLIQITATDPNPQRSAEIANAVSQSLTKVVSKIEPSTKNANTSAVKLTRVQDATIPIKPSGNNSALTLAVGFAIGFILGIAFAIMRDMLNNRVRDESDLKELTGVPIIGRVPFDNQVSRQPLVVHTDAHSPRAEAFRVLRTNLQFLDLENRPRSLVVTSSVRGEGKSSTAANLAIAMADAGSHVLLIDADLRQPEIADYMGIEAAAGLTDVLSGRSTLPEVIRPWGNRGLQVLPAGSIPPNPSELLGSRAAARLIEAFEQEFDAVIIDSPPLLPVTDAAILARTTGGAVVVVGVGIVRRAQVTSALATLASVGARALGVVATMLPKTVVGSNDDGRSSSRHQRVSSRVSAT